MSRHNVGVVHWVEVAGYPMPQRYAGHPALEFCNTWAGWQEAVWSPDHPDGRRRDWIRHYDWFAVWAGYVELLDETTVATLRRLAAEEPDDTDDMLDRARELRNAAYQVVARPDGTGVPRSGGAAPGTAPSGLPPPADAFELVATTARRARGAAELVDERHGTVRAARWRLPASVGLELPLLAVAEAAADLLTGPDRSRVRSCPGRDCGWLFIDRRGRRRWCSMESCGNRAKVKAHAQRRRSSGATGPDGGAGPDPSART